MKRTPTLLALAGSLLLVPVASAHVTVNPNEVPADSFSRFAVRVPNEEANAGTTKIVMQLPQGLFFVSFQPKPGWKRTITMEKLDQPVELFGETQTERVATVTWEGGTIAPGEFDEFGLSAKVPAEATTIAFPTTQTYSNGKVVRWIGAADADTPAPRVTLTPVVEEAPAPGTIPAATTEVEETDDEDSDLEGLALGLGAAGLVTGLAALVLTLVRRPRRT